MSLRGAAAATALLCCAPSASGAAPLSLVAGGKLTLSLDPSTLAYKIGIGGAEWATGSANAAARWSANAGCRYGPGSSPPGPYAGAQPGGAQNP